MGNLPYDQFLERVGTVLDALLLAMKQGAYAVWVLKDFRDLRAKVPYVNLHGDFIAIAQQSGYVLWDIRIYDQTRYRPLVCLGYPSKNFYLNLGHSYIITLRKP